MYFSYIIMSAVAVLLNHLKILVFFCCHFATSCIYDIVFVDWVTNAHVVKTKSNALYFGSILKYHTYVITCYVPCVYFRTHVSMNYAPFCLLFTLYYCKIHYITVKYIRPKWVNGIATN